MEAVQENKELKQLMRSNGLGYSIRSNRDRFFYPNEWLLFFEALTNKQKLTFDTLINTGARINEVRNIKVADIDWDRGNIILRVTKIKARKDERTPRPRTISVNNNYLKKLKKHISQNKLQLNDCLGILSTPAANIAMKKTLKEIGILDWQMFSVHNIRKTHGNWLKALGIDGAEICLRLGHDYNTFLKSYGSPDIFSYKDLQDMRIILGDLYLNRKV